MTIRSYKKVFFTDSGPKRPFAKGYYQSSIEDVLGEWETNQGTLKKMDQPGSIMYRLDFINHELLERRFNLKDIDFSFSDNLKYCVVRRKYIPEGKVRERYELEILEQVNEIELSPKEEAFILRLKEFQERGCESQLCISLADIEAIQAIDSHFGCYYPDCEYIESIWKINLGPLEQYMDEAIVKKCPISSRQDAFALAVRSALYQCDSVDHAIELANSVFKECGCGRRLSDDELLKFNVKLDNYHKYWPHCYIGEKSGFYFVTYNFDCQASGVTDKPEAFENIINEAGYTAWALAAYSGGGHYRCGGVPI